MIRPFSESAKVKCRSYSSPLQRVITDFAADLSFEETSKKIEEHYGIKFPASSIRIITEKHAKNIETKLDLLQEKNKTKNIDTIISESDGGMIPLLEIQKDFNGDRRKTRKVKWGENRLSLAYAKGSITPFYGSTMGGVDEAGKQIEKVVKLAGQNEKTHIHFVGDGAPWIADQVDTIFGSKSEFLLDFFHLSEYLYGAAKCCDPLNPIGWAEKQKQLMKENRYNEVISEIEKHINQLNNDHDCLAKVCYQYMIKRTKQFNYKSALENDLPIGSGEIESGHKSVIQKRLKLPGGWWLKENASYMAALRILRANGFWNNYWSNYKNTEYN